MPKKKTIETPQTQDYSVVLRINDQEYTAQAPTLEAALSSIRIYVVYLGGSLDMKGPGLDTTMALHPLQIKRYFGLNKLPARLLAKQVLKQYAKVS